MSWRAFHAPSLRSTRCSSTGACVDVDERAAATNPCGPGTCRDNAGSYLCACPAGFRAVSAPAITCVDVDECRGRLDDCDTTPEAGESSSTSGLGAAQTPGTAYGAGAAYLFSRTTLGVWSQTVFIKAPNAASGDNFGHSIALSDDGATLAVGAPNEGSAATGIDGDPRNDEAPLAGAVYSYRRSATGVWSEEAYVKASNTDEGDTFGDSVALSSDGRTLAVGALGERSVARGVGVDDTDNGSVSAGAVYVY